MNSQVILLVEDNQSDIELTRRAFKKSNIFNELIVVEDGAEALDFLYGNGKYQARNIHELPALILLDLNMPKISGKEVLTKIKSSELTSRVPVVILTSSSEKQEIAECYDLGANSFIRKPVDFAQFSEAVKMLGHYWLVLNEAPPLK